MQLFDILLIVSVITLVLALWKDKLTTPLMIVGVGVLLLQLIVDGYHWQLIPVYGAFVLSAAVFFAAPAKRWVKYISGGMILVLTILGALLVYLMPVFGFPQPTGQYTVGFRRLFLEDSSRPETISKEPGDFRKLTVNVWYPSNKKIVSPEPYFDEGYNFAYASHLGAPGIIVSHFPQINTHIQRNLSIISGTMPVIILSHGLAWNSEMYTSLISELVSRGYMVFGIEHTYEAPITIFKGERIFLDREVLDAMDEDLDFNAFQPLLEEFKTEEDTAQKRRQMQRMVHILPYNQSFDRWSADISFVMDELTELNNAKNHFLYQKLDLEKIAMLGHSWGGAAVVQNAAFDSRAKAVVNLDGAQWGRVIDTTLTTPLMAVFADRDYSEFFTPNFFVYDQITSSNYYEVTITNTGHTSFSDMPYWTRVPQYTESGTIKAEKTTLLTADLLDKFFQKFVLQEKVDLVPFFDSIEYGEIDLEKRK